ncbi:MAG: ferredoxin--NADP reductase [Gammaproteobacteria bacterium]|jgi:ferredoxin-NADP reductase
MSRVQFPITLVDSQTIADSVKHFTFVRADNQPFPFIPGQFVNLHFKVGDEMLQRSYSIATIATEPGPQIELALSHVSNGKASGYLFNMKVGDAIEASGPFGRLILRDDEKPKRYILVATGTGVTPYRAMLAALEKRMKEDGCEVIVLLGARTSPELLYQAEFLNFMQQHPQFKFYGCCSRKTENELQAHQRHGYVQEMFAELELAPNDDIVYLCGNPHMVDDAYKLLIDIGFDKQNVRREKYVFSH